MSAEFSAFSAYLGAPASARSKQRAVTLVASVWLHAALAAGLVFLARRNAAPTLIEQTPVRLTFSGGHTGHRHQHHPTAGQRKPRHHRPRPRQLTQPAMNKMTTMTAALLAPAAPAPVETTAPPETPSTDDSESGAADVPAAASAHDVGFSAIGADGPYQMKDVARRPVVLYQVKPNYPSDAQAQRLEGMVIVRVIIGIDGLVETAHTRVVQSVPGLDAAAVAAIARWRFSPAQSAAGQPVRVIVDVPFEFFLR